MRNRIKTGLLLVASLFTQISYSQVYKVWDNVIQANWTLDGWYLQMEKTPSGKLIATCLSRSDSGYDKTMNQFNALLEEPWVMMMDANGNKLWDRDFYGAVYPRGITIFDENTICVIANIGASSILGDVTAPVTPGTNNSGAIWLVAFDTLGTILWNKRFGAGYDSTSIIPQAGGWSSPTDVKVVNGKVYVLGFSIVKPTVKGGDLLPSSCPNHPFLRDMLFYKVSPNDTLTNEWQHTYGGDSVEWGTTVLPIQSGGFLIGGNTTSMAGCNQTVSAYQSPYNDFYVLKTDANGNINWQQRYGGSKEEFLNGIIAAGNNEYLLYGRTISPMSYDISTNGYNDTSLWIVKIDSAGNKIWDKRYGSCYGFNIWAYSQIQDPFYGVKTIDGIATIDGGFLFVSNVIGTLVCGDVSEPGKGFEDYWMLKLDSAGNKQWDKRFGGPGRDIAERVVEMRPGYYIIGGYSRGLTPAERAIGGDKSEITIGYDDLWFVGVVDSNALVGVHEMPVNSFQFSVYPNPAHDNVTFILNPGERGTLIANIYDITGKLLIHQFLPSESLAKDGNSSAHQQINTSFNLNISTLSCGIYIVEVKDVSGNAVRKKLLKQ